MKHIRKRTLGILLTLVMLLSLVPGMSLTAHADGGSDYTITIPATLTVENSGWNDAGGISVTGTLEANKKLIVSAGSDGEYALVSGENKVAYTLAATSGGAETTSWEFTTLPGSASLGIIVEDYSNKPAGTYTDTVTFTAAVENAGIPVESVTITNAPTEALFVNSTGTLTATVSPDNATDKTVTWSSSDPDYVSINATTGEYQVKGTKGYGSATITATAGDKTATCTITGKVTYTSLSAGTVLHVGDTFYAGKVYFNTTPAVSFQDSNGVITLVENNGCYKFQRGSNGTMPNVTAYKIKDNTDGIYIVSGSGTSSDKFVLAVHNSSIPVTSITLNKSATEIDVGQTETLSVTAVTPDDATNKTVTWSSDNIAVATVNATTGEVTAVAKGTANIIATANDGSGVTATCAVTVKQLHSITFTGPYSNATLVMEYYEGDTWEDMAVKYPTYIKIYSGRAAFYTDGFIYDQATYDMVQATAQIDPNKTYVVE